MKRRFLQRSILMLMMLVVATMAYSIAPPPPPPAPPVGVPIDGAVFLLLGAGLVYGARKLYKEQ